MNMTVGQLIHELHNHPQFKQYQNEDAMYDDVFYADVPIGLFGTIDITYENLNQINENTEDYEGNIKFTGDYVTIIGAA